MEKNAKKLDESLLIQKPINDLGIAAYMMMHGYEIIGRHNRTVYFQTDESEEQNFNKLSFEYLSSSYHDFDSCLMSLKKVGEFDPKKYVEKPLMRKPINDLGIAAYMMMNKYKVIGRYNRTVYFEINELDERKFDGLSFKYLSSPYHTFDSCLMALKKVGEFDPNR